MSKSMRNAEENRSVKIPGYVVPAEVYAAQSLYN